MSLVSDLQFELDEVSGAKFWLDATLHDALNEAQLETYSSVQNWQVTTATLTMSAELSAIPISSIMIPQYVLRSNTRLLPTDHVQLEDWSGKWKNTSPAKPSWLVLWDAETFRCYPRPDQTYTDTLLVGTPWPTEISTATQDLSIDPLIRKSIILKAASLILEDTQPELADIKQIESIEYEKRYKKQWRNSLAPIERLRPGTAWQLAHSGNIGVGKRFTP